MTPPDPTFADVRAAAERIAGRARRTPLLPLDDVGPGALGPDLWAKPENLQRTGSFKLRGATNFLAAMDPAQRARGVVTHSSGNHGQAVACAAHAFGVPATVVIPEGAPEVKVARTQGWGATVLRCANTASDRARGADEVVQREGATLVPPFDHPWIVAGQATAALEIAQDLDDIANVLVPVGGGGLSAGTVLALETLAPRARVIGVEPALAADAQESLRRGEPIAWPAEKTTRTWADGVQTQRLGDLPFRLLSQRLEGIVTVPEEALRPALGWWARHARLVVEPTGALTLAGWHRLTSGASDEVRLAPGRTVLMISGGNVDEAVLSSLGEARPLG
ncbi:MAG: threonine/serine dehydratase [Trueperaceae bacterium]|nr:threonine/serine dehydratase [Trueperaceae bacterium]